MSSVADGEGRSTAVHRSPPGAGAGLACLAVLVPVWQPGERCVALVSALVAAGFGRVIVVDDGSRETCAPVFAHVVRMERVVVLRHPVNRGKGRALKTGFAYALGMSAAGEEVRGVVTADADGQHTPEDIVRVGEALLGADGAAVLGVRQFGDAVPWRSRVGNKVARRLFAFFSGRAVSDTQTGLRGLPLASLPALLRLPGERYEYEMTMLAQLCQEGAQPVEVPIATVYLEGNRGSHFHPVWDSVRVYAALMRSWLRLRPWSWSPLSLRAAHTGGDRR